MCRKYWNHYSDMFELCKKHFQSYIDKVSMSGILSKHNAKFSLSYDLYHFQINNQEKTYSKKIIISVWFTFINATIYKHIFLILAQVFMYTYILYLSGLFFIWTETIFQSAKTFHYYFLSSWMTIYLFWFLTTCVKK